MELVRSKEAGDPLAGVALAYQDSVDDELLSLLKAAASELREWLPVLHDLLAEQPGSLGNSCDLVCLSMFIGWFIRCFDVKSSCEARGGQIPSRLT